MCRKGKSPLHLLLEFPPILGSKDSALTRVVRPGMVTRLEFNTYPTENDVPDGDSQTPDEVSQTPDEGTTPPRLAIFTNVEIV